MLRAILSTDGGSRGNPGPAGIGFELCGQEGQLLASGGWNLAYATNNQAEYSALIWGLENALAAGVSHLEVHADSELMVKQINGAYRVKNEDLKPLFLRCKLLLLRFSMARLVHVRRELNQSADALVNRAMDAGCPTGSYLVPWEAQSGSLFDALEESSSGEKEEKAAACGGQELLSAALNVERCSDMEKNAAYTGPARLSGLSYEDRGGTYEVNMKAHFDAAHTLPGYDGPCRYLHGHTWDVEVSICGAALDEAGVLYDFKDIKRDLNALLENFDHRYINDTPPFDAISPTAENLARVVYFEFAKTLPEGLALQSVTIWESPQARIVYRP